MQSQDINTGINWKKIKKKNENEKGLEILAYILFKKDNFTSGSNTKLWGMSKNILKKAIQKVCKIVEENDAIFWMKPHSGGKKSN